MRTSISQANQQYKPNAPRRSDKTLKNMLIGTAYAVCRVAGYGLVGLGCIFLIPKVAATSLMNRFFPGFFGLASYITLETMETIVSSPKNFWFKPREQQASHRELLEVIGELEDMARVQKLRLDRMDIGGVVGKNVTDHYQIHLKNYMS